MSWGPYNIRQILNLHWEDLPGTSEEQRAGLVTHPSPVSTPAFSSSLATGSTVSLHSAKQAVSAPSVVPKLLSRVGKYLC